MGVHGLWELVAPVGRRVSVETLAGKRVAVDASIWMVQFMRAMRDEKGDMVRDAHLLGFLRRICKLLFLRARPVFVFDGATPPLKRRTLAARRRHRDAAQAKVRKTAEKLLLSHLKARKLEELAAEIRSDRAKHDAKGKQVESNRGEGPGTTNGNQFHNENSESSGRAVAPISQEKLDELLAASLAAEEDADLTDKGKYHSANVPLEGAEIDEEDDDEDIVFPVTASNIDPAVLASLPPSMQLDLLVQMRERVMAENRQKYQKIKKEPAKFSELQIQSYLKTVAFRREIDEVQRFSAGKGVGGVQTSKIASEANREFIFSSSFTGDKQMLVQRGGNEQIVDRVNSREQISSAVLKSDPPSGSKQPDDGESLRDFGPDVETFRDERGRIRVSRVRAMGIRMTRDIQRNLDFIKEHEQVKSRGQINLGQGSTTNEEPLNFPDHLFESNEPQSWSSLSIREDFTEVINGSHQVSSQGGSGNVSESSLQGSKETIEISFLDDQTEVKDNDDQIFLHLVSGTSSNLLSDNDHLAKNTEESDDTECIWEEGTVGGEILPTKADEKEYQSSQLDNCCTEDEVEWEEGGCDVPVVPSKSGYNPGKVPKGDMEEAALIQEAIRRSLEDFEKQESENVILENLQASCDADIPKLSGTASETYFHSEADLVRETVEEVGIGMNSERNVVCDPGVLAADRREDENQAQLVNNDGATDMNRAYSHESVPPSDISTSTIAAKPFITDSSKGQENDEMADTNRIHGRSKVDDDNVIKNNSMNSDIYTDSNKSKILAADAYMGGTSKSFQKDLMMDELVADTALQEEKVNEGDMKFSTSERVYTKMSDDDDSHNMSAANLEKEISLLRQEQIDLGNERRKLESHAESVSSEMFAECQELLQMFGLPYIIAPMEAEAQCAYMEMNNLVDGVVTDDSDVFLFGARNVYKNIFDDRKYVETYFMKDIELELGLTREQLIRMALLLGSDYTEGISGIGIVNAIEVVHAFPEEDGLQKFREWIESPDPAILGKVNMETGSNCKKRKPDRNDPDGKGKKLGLESEGSDDKQSSSDTQHIKEIFMSKHRNVSKNWHIPPTFPSQSVITAYISPQVDESTEPFSWGRPDLSLLRKLCWERFGWSKEKADELLLPVLREYNKHETQLRLEAFYSFNERFAKIRSQRIKKAIKGITGKSFPETNELEQDHPSASNNSKKKKTSSSNCARGRGKRNKNAGGARSFADIDEYVQENNNTRKKEIGSSSGRSRGRGQGRPNAEYGTMGSQDDTKIENSTSASDENSHEKVKNNHRSEGMTLRKSKRQRKQVTYMEDDHEADDSDVLINQMDQNDLSQATRGKALACRDTLSDLVHQDMSKMNSDLIHTDPNTAEFMNQDTSGFECEDPHIDSAPKEYLFTGGGFCMEKIDEQDDTMGDLSAGQSGEEMMEHGTSDACKDISGASDNGKSMLPSRAEESTEVATMEASEQLNWPAGSTSPAQRRNTSRGLSAMPTLLKRKRDRS